jgi:hypothetical protein
MKICPTCKCEKPPSEFALSKDKRDGRAYVCKVCTNAYNKVHYQANKPAYIAKVRRWESRALERMRELKSKPCADCGGSFHYSAMDFDHVDGKKEFSLSAAHKRGLRKIEDEMAKCEVVCANGAYIRA